MNRFLTGRFLTFFGFALTLVGATMSSASAEVNIHNGVVVIRNESHTRIHFVMDIGFRESAEIAAGATWTSSTCCYAAGTTYRMQVLGSDGKTRTVAFRPHLCSTRGIPYGYAVVVETNDGARIVDEHNCYE